MAATKVTIAAVKAILADNFAPWVQATGITVTAIEANGVRLTIPYSDQLCRVGGIMAGQTLAAGADTAMVLALAVAMGGVLKPCTTVDMTISYMRPITKANAVLDAKVKRLGRSLAFCSVDIFEAGTDKSAAFATGTFAILS